MSSKRSKYRFGLREGPLFITIFLFICVNLIFTFSSCKTGHGCKATEQYQVKTDKHGTLSMKRGKTRLFDKKTEKIRKARKSRKS